MIGSGSNAGNALPGASSWTACPSAIIVQMDATTARVPPGWRGRIDTVGNLILERTA